MSNLIPVVQLDKDEEPKAISNLKVERPLEEEDAQTLAKMPWREYLRRAGYNKDADKMCELCIKEQKEKYNGRTPIVCNGYRDFSTILREKYGDVADELTASLSETELNILKAEFDPKAWFETYARDVTKLQDRYYQTQILKCSAKNKVIRAGRRCVAKGELVCMADGSFKPIEEVKKGDKVLSHKGGELVSSEVYNTMNNGIAPVFEVRTSEGYLLKITADHQLLSESGWKSIDEGLSIGDKIKVSASLPKPSSARDISTDQAKLLGYMLADGYINKKGQTPKFTSNSPLYVQEVKEIASRLFGYECTIKDRADCKALDIWLTDGNKGSRNLAKAWLESLDISSPKSKMRTGVSLLGQLSDEVWASLVNRAWAGDGCISTWTSSDRPNGKRFALSLTTSDRLLGIALKLSLLQRGINGAIKKERPRVWNIKGKQGFSKMPTYKLEVSATKSARKFLELVGNVYGKEEKCIEVLEESSKRESREYENQSFKWVTIKSIEPVGEEEVYDISVAKTANFIANGIVVHNCGKTFAIAMYVLARIGQATEPLEVLVAAPGLGQIEEIKQTVETLADNLDIPGFITSSKQAPYLQINFYNGCKIKGITTGKDGKGSRGKRADILWLDEVDFIPADAMTAVLGVMLDNPHVERIYTSTPIGHKHLFEFASKPSTKEFHFPSFARPDYDDNMHNETTEFTDIRYCQEVLGVYGVDASGVFPLSYIKKSFDNFIPHFYNKSFVLNNRERFLVFIGVDWNHDNNGTRILVVGYDKEVGRFFKIEGFKIAKLQMTQALAVDTVVQVNREFNADHILCDQGFGTAQISQLRLKGQEQYGKVPPDHPDLKLVDTISVDFGSSLTITDPTSKQPLKRNTKQYIVEHAQKLLEDNKLALHQDQDHDLIEQLKSYVVARTGMRGTIYKAGDKKIGDHDLDAFMLALYGFDYFYGEFISPHVAGYASVIGTGDYRYAAANRSLSEIGSTFRTGRTKSARAGTPKRARSRAF